jgi:hypothetical protein
MTATLMPVEQATLCGDSRCAAPLYDGFTLCPQHSSKLKEMLDAVPQAWANLRVSIARQDVIGGSGSRGATGSKPCINVHAYDIGETLISRLNGWANCLSPDRAHTPPPGSAAFLARNLDMIVHEDWAGALADELRESLNEARNATDPAADRIDLGVCGEDGCERRVTAIVGTLYTTCRGCGVLWSVKDRQLTAIDNTWRAGATMPVILRALRAYDIIVRPKDAENWVQRGKLVACVWADGTKHYQVAAVRRVHAEMMAKRSR